MGLMDDFTTRLDRYLHSLAVINRKPAFRAREWLNYPGYSRLNEEECVTAHGFTTTCVGLATEKRILQDDAGSN